MAEKIPNEIMLDIFSRLDIESLFRVKFACCKAWRYMIDDDPCFVNTHLARTAKSPGVPLLITDDNFTLFHALKEDGDKHAFRTSLVAEIVIDETNNIRASLCGSCNGLLLFASKCNVFICNPLLKEVMTIPAKCSFYQDFYELGFGFDLKSNTYKIVHVRFYGGKYDDVEVYTLGANKWRKISQKPAYIILNRPLHKPVFAHGALHWITEIDDMVMSFDLGKEEFYVTPCPGSGFRYLVQLDGLLALVNHLSSKKCVEIWLWNKLENCDGTKKWTKEYKIDVNKAWHMLYNTAIKWKSFGSLKVMGMWPENGEIVLKSVDKFFTFNRKNDSFRRVTVDSMTAGTKFINFRGSLVSPR